MRLPSIIRDLMSHAQAGEKMPPIFVVTLPEEQWKRELLKKHFHEHELAPVFVEGLQGVTLGLKPTNPYEYDQLGQGLFVHASQVGCVLSHRLALSVAIASGAKEFIVCEDDIEFAPGFVESFQQWRSEVPAGTHVAHLEYVYHHGTAAREISDHVWNVWYPWCAGCLWWTREGALKALPLLRPVDRPYDQMLIQKVFPFLNHVVAWPALATQKSRGGLFPSSVGDAPKCSSNQANAEENK